MIEKIVADTALRVVLNVFRRSPAEDAANEKRYFRVKNLTAREVVEFVNLWEAEKEANGVANVRVVIAGDASVEVPESYFAEPDRSITWYRNNNEGGLVYLETKVESDEQGLKNLFTLRDSNFLDGTFNADDFNVGRELMRAAWRAVNGGTAPLRGALETAVCDVLSSLQQVHIPVPLRRFARLAEESCRRYADESATLAKEEIDALVGQSLVTLGLFPDPDWRTDSNKIRVSRRLEANSRFSELRRLDGTDLEPEEGMELASRTVFRDREREPLPEDEQKKWRTLCAQFCRDRTTELRRSIPYEIFEQLFQRDLKGLKLGERVYLEIQAAAIERVEEFETLGVKSGLDQRDSKAAQIFLEAEAPPSEDSAPALADLLTQRTRKTVQRLAYPNPESFANPLLKIADVASTFLSTRNKGRPGDVVLRMKPGRDFAKENPGVGLLSFIYGAAFQALEAGDGDSGLRLEVDESFRRPISPPAVKANDDGDDKDLAWSPVPVDFEFVEVATDDVIDIDANYQWNPPELDHMALLWLFLSAKDAPDDQGVLQLSPGDDFESFASHVVGREVRLDAYRTATFLAEALTCPLLAPLIETRHDFGEAACQHGLSDELILGYFDRWSDFLEEARKEYVPKGSTDPRLVAALQLDTVVSGDGTGLLVLPTHPFRLRWLGHYLKASIRIASEALADELKLNNENPQFYLKWLEGLSPHQQPPVAAVPSQQIVFSQDEQGWSERFAVISPGHGDGLYGTVDSRSIGELKQQLVYYVDAHPHKRDGLSVLMVLPEGGTDHVRLMQSFLGERRLDVPVSLCVVAPRAYWGKMARDFDALRVPDRVSRADALFPRFHLYFVDWQEGVSESAPNLPEADIAIVSNFFRSKVILQHHTEAPATRPGHFDVLLDRPTHSYGDDEGGAVSVSMKPLSPDRPLENWSTLVVRNARGRPVAQSNPENCDFVELQVSFEAAAALFTTLHERVHWVITLDQHVSRLQLESLEPAPDILTVREGVGASQLFTLVVSSGSGRHHVISRLERKLADLFEPDGPVARIANEVYNETRTVVPRLALQAMGLSRRTEEMLGLVIAMRSCKRHFPSPEGATVIWLSLDEHAEWFGGDSATRADLCRVSLSRVETGIAMDILVVEAKLREQFDPHGIDQVRRTSRLLRAVFDSTESCADGRLWREEFLRAIENTNLDARDIQESLQATGAAPHLLPDDIREKVRDGDLETVDVKGTYTIALKADGVQSSVDKHDADLYEVRIGPDEMRALLTRRDVDGAGARLPDTPRDEAEDEPDRVGVSPGPVEPARRQDEQHQMEEDRPSEPVPGDEPSTPPSVSGGRLSADELKRRHEQVIDALGEFQVKVSPPDPTDPVDGAVEGPASVLFRVRPGTGVQPSRVYDKAEGLKLKMKLDAAQNITFGISHGFVNIDIPKREDERYFVDASELWTRWSKPEDGTLRVPLGEDRFGGVVAINFSSSNSPHLLIGGTTGSGKSEALNTILAGLTNHYAPSELRLLLIDPKGTELNHLDNSPYLEGEIGWDDDDARGLLARAVEEMQRRYKVFKSVRVRSIVEYNKQEQVEEPMPWWLLVLDEYADLTSDPDAKKALEAHLKRLAQKARAAGIHLIVATQKPAGDVISTNLRSNLPAQLALRVKSATESRVIMDEGGAEGLNGKGDAFFRSEGGVTRVQCARVQL